MCFFVGYIMLTFVLECLFTRVYVYICWFMFVTKYAGVILLYVGLCGFTLGSIDCVGLWVYVRLCNVMLV